MTAFSNFQHLDPERRETTRGLFRHSRRQQSSFGSFAGTWFAFNGWMECVTDARTDAEMIASMANNDRLADAYLELQKEPDFRRAVDGFAGRWPVINVRDARRKLGPDVFWIESQEELIERCSAAGVKMQPTDWTEGNEPTWARLLRTVYMVRCNMFHGAKSPLNMRDQRLIRDSDKVLTMFIERSGCFEWND
jgi:hypothetical protein